MKKLFVLWLFSIIIWLWTSNSMYSNTMYEEKISQVKRNKIQEVANIIINTSKTDVKVISYINHIDKIYDITENKRNKAIIIVLLEKLETWIWENNVSRVLKNIEDEKNNLSEISCNNIWNVINKKFGNINYCDTDSDCGIADDYCCWRIMNVNYIKSYEKFVLDNISCFDDRICDCIFSEIKCENNECVQKY